MAGRRAVGLRGGEAGGQKLVIALEVDGAGSEWWDTASNCINRGVRETSCGPLIATQTNAVLAEQRAALWRATRKPSPLPRASGAAAGRWRHESSRRPRAPALQPPVAASRRWSARAVATPGPALGPARKRRWHTRAGRDARSGARPREKTSLAHTRRPRRPIRRSAPREKTTSGRRATVPSRAGRTREPLDRTARQAHA